MKYRYIKSFLHDRKTARSVGTTDFIIIIIIIIIIITPSEAVDVFRSIWCSYHPSEVSHICNMSFGMWQTAVPYHKIEILALFKMFT